MPRIPIPKPRLRRRRYDIPTLEIFAAPDDSWTTCCDREDSRPGVSTVTRPSESRDRAYAPSEGLAGVSSAAYGCRRCTGVVLPLARRFRNSTKSEKAIAK